MTLSARLGVFLVVRRGGALPLPRATARVAPTDGNKERGKRGVEDAAPTHGRWVRGGACSYGVDRVPVGGNDETSAAVMRLGSSI